MPSLTVHVADYTVALQPSMFSSTALTTGEESDEWVDVQEEPNGGGKPLLAQLSHLFPKKSFFFSFTKASWRELQTMLMVNMSYPFVLSQMVHIDILFT